MISEAQAHKYCREPLDKIEGYAIAISSPETYEVHHRFGELASSATLKEIHYYYGRPACELIFIPRVLHLKLHRLGHPMKESSKALLREKRLGQPVSAQARASIKAGVLRHLQEHPEVREKLREVWRDESIPPETISKMKLAASTRGDEYLKKNSAAVKKAEQLEVAAYREYKAAGGPLKWSAWRHFHKTKKGKPMRCLITADWHISGTRPRCRADEDWMESQRKDIEAVWQIARDKRVEAVWILGDLFDTSRVATEAVNLVLTEFEQAPCNVYTLCGNHDLPYHSFDLLERSSIGTILHKFPMLGTDPNTGVVAYPFGKEPEYGALSDYMKANGMHTWITHQLTFPDDASRPIPGIGVLAQELLDACPAASVILTGDYHHGYIYTAPDGRRVITPGCLNIGDADMKDYQPQVYVFDTFDLSVEAVNLPIHGKIETTYLEHEHALADMKEKFVASLSAGAITMKSFTEALNDALPTLPDGVRKVLEEVKESTIAA